jgi:hypothetical protein
MRTVSALLTSLSLLVCVVRATPAPAAAIHTLTPEEFAKAGLNKLTPEELVYLEEALARHQQVPNSSSPAVAAAQTTGPIVPTEKVVKSTDKAAASFGSEQVTPAPRVVSHEELHAHIEGTIESFSGRAVFVLDNGQIWQQRIPDTVYFTPKLVNPEVIITRGFVGYKMLIVPANRIVFVKRVQ